MRNVADSFRKTPFQILNETHSEKEMGLAKGLLNFPPTTIFRKTEKRKEAVLGVSRASRRRRACDAIMQAARGDRVGMRFPESGTVVGGCMDGMGWVGRAPERKMMTPPIPS